jgi:hypothetical protein
MYRHLVGTLRAHGMSPGDIAAEKVFLDDVGARGSRLLEIRRDFWGGADPGIAPPAVTLTGQPPPHPGQECEVQAVVLRPPRGSSLPSRRIDGLPPGPSGSIQICAIRDNLSGPVRGGRRPGGTALAGLAVRIFLTMLVVIDPVGLVPMFLAPAGERAAAEQGRIALRAILVATGIFAPFGIGGACPARPVSTS